MDALVFSNSYIEGKLFGLFWNLRYYYLGVLINICILADTIQSVTLFYWSGEAPNRPLKYWVERSRYVERKSSAQAFLSLVFNMHQTIATKLVCGLTLKIIGRRQAQLAEGPVDCDVRFIHAIRITSPSS